jgi:hypothetical protein
MYLLDYECISSAGVGVEALISGLYSSKIHSQKIKEDLFFRSVPSGGSVCFLSDHAKLTTHKAPNSKNRFAKYLKSLCERINSRVTPEQFVLMKNKNVLCILSSTKGCVEDTIWDNQSGDSDPFTSLYDDLRQQLDFPNLQIMTVSNACSSSHVATEAAKYFLDSNIYDYVFVVAFDFIGPFVYSGFQSLKVLSQTQNKPFSGERDGLQLGEAMAVLLFSAVKTKTTKVQITGIASLVEPSSVTRPKTDGKSLLKVMEKVFFKSDLKPDFFLAHGTGTVFNDLTEENAYREFQLIHHMNVPITSTKWSIGHCLGASGAMDIIAAAEIMKHNKLFNIASTSSVDKNFVNLYQIANNQISDIKNLQSAIVTSLGFGGVYAALSIGKVSEGLIS